MGNIAIEPQSPKPGFFDTIVRVRLVVGVLITVLVAFGGGAVWVYRVDAAASQGAADIENHGARITELERWQIRTDAEKFTAKDAGKLVERLTSLEQSNAEIYRTLQRIDSKIP